MAYREQMDQKQKMTLRGVFRGHNYDYILIFAITERTKEKKEQSVQLQTQSSAIASLLLQEETSQFQLPSCNITSLFLEHLVSFQKLRGPVLWDHSGEHLYLYKHRKEKKKHEILLNALLKATLNLYSQIQIHMDFFIKKSSKSIQNLSGIQKVSRSRKIRNRSGFDQIVILHIKHEPQAVCYAVSSYLHPFGF